MPEKIDSFDARTKLPEILRRVAAGESFTITNRGEPVADIMPGQSVNHAKTQAAIDNIMAAKKHVVSDQELAGLRNEGRK